MGENQPVMDAWECVRCGEENRAKRGTMPLFCENPNCGKKGPFRAKSGPYMFYDYFMGGRFKFIPKKLAEHIQKEKRFLTHINSHVCWVYNGGSYVPTGKEFIEGRVRACMHDLATASLSNEVFSHIRETTYAEPEAFEAPINLINVKNGVLNLETLELTPHSPDVVFLNEVPVEWKPEAECPAIMEFVSQVVSKEDIDILQEMAGYCLYRQYWIAKAFMLLGEGQNGKSTWLNLLMAMLGRDNVCTPSLQDLLENRFARADLYGKLANIHADIPSRQLDGTGIFKMLTGQDMVRAELKNQNAFQFCNYAKLLYSCNELPRTNDKTEAFWRRWVIVLFPNRFAENDPKTDPNLLKKLTTPEELSGMLTWAVKGLQRLLENKHFTASASWAETETTWILRTDSLRAFLKNHAKENPTWEITKEMFYNIYLAFCDANDIKPQEKATVGRRLQALFPKARETHPVVDGKQVRAWGGIELLNIKDITDITEFATPNLIGKDVSPNRGEVGKKRNISNTVIDGQSTLSQFDKANIVISVISELDEDAADLNDVIRLAGEQGVPQSFVEVYVAEEKRRGHLTEPRPGFVRRSVR